MNRDVFLKLLTRKLSAELSTAELREFRDAIDSNLEFRQLDEELTKYFELSGGRSPGENSVEIAQKLQSVWKSIDVAKTIKVSFFSRYSYFLRIAAILAVLLTVGVIFFNYKKTQRQADVILVNSGDQKIFMTLDDGTKVWLNRQSSISYNEAFGKLSRKITLRGEAFFDVVKNPDVPLSIDAGRVIISVKGTAFNVKTYGQAGNLEVALVRGLVELNGIQDKIARILLKPNEKFVLLPQNSNGLAQYKVLKLNAGLENTDAKWRLDSLMFKKEKLKDLAQHLEIRYKVKIEIQNEQLKNTRFSGLFTSEPLRDALEALKLSYPLSYQIIDQRVIIK